MKNHLAITTLLIALAATVVHSGSVPADTTDATPAFDPTLVVARIGNSELTLGQIRGIIEANSMFRSNPADDQKRRTDMLDRLIDDQLVSFDARTISLKDNLGALARVRRSVTLAAATIHTQDIINSHLKLDSITIDTFYHNHISRYTSPRDQRRVRIITVWKEGKAPGQGTVDYHDSLYAGWYPEDKIDSIYIRLSEGEDFAALASVHSEDALTRGAGGDLGWVSEHSLGATKVSEVAMHQPLYMYSKPFETDAAWHIVQAIADRPAGPVPLNAEIGMDIITTLATMQKDKMLKELGDSLLAVAKIDWHEEYSTTPHEELKDGMILAIVNKRDTVFAAEFLQEQYKWMDNQTQTLPDAARRGEILRSDYVRFVCWYGLLREQGYLDHPQVVVRREQVLQEERENIVRSRIAAGPFPEPDSATIEKYYRDSVHLYGTGPNALNFAWNSIKSKLTSDARDDAHRRWRKAAYARHGVIRYDDRLALVPFLEPRSRKK